MIDIKFTNLPDSQSIVILVQLHPDDNNNVINFYSCILEVKHEYDKDVLKNTLRKTGMHRVIQRIILTAIYNSLLPNKTVGESLENGLPYHIITWVNHLLHELTDKELALITSGDAQ